MIGLKDVANACGVSETQVSRALGDKPGVGEKTKFKIKETAKKMGYVKNFHAQSLASGTSNQIVLVINGLKEDNNRYSSSMILDVMRGLNSFVLEVGCEFALHIVDESNTSFLNFCRQRNIPGIVVCGMKYDDPKFKELVSSDFPCVAIDIPIEGENKGCVLINNSFYTISLIHKVIERGRKRIAMITGHSHAVVTAERNVGYQSALMMSGIEYDDTIIISGDFDYDRAYEATKKLFSAHQDIDAVFCHSDIMALGCIKALQDMHLRVPRDVAVIGFDGVVLGEFSTPTLSTVKQDNVKKGYAAGKLLHEILHNTAHDNTVMVPCEVVMRKSL